MKNIITVAALLAAGTACANALTLVGTYTESTTASNVDTWNVGQTLTTSASTNYALVYTLNLDAFVASLNDDSLLGKKIVNTSKNYGLGTNADGLLTFSNVATGVATPTSTSTSWAISSEAVTLSTSWLKNGEADLVGAAIVFSVGVSISGTSSSGTAGISLLYSDGTTADYFGTNSSYKSGSWSFSSVSAISGLVSSVSVYSGSPDEVANTTFLATTAQSVIPEPSAFGLLAGAGALALVAARRRRSK